MNPEAETETRRRTKKAKSPRQRLEEAKATPQAHPGNPYVQDTEASKKPRVESTPEAPKKTGRLYTVSVAVPASILPPIYSLELKTFIAGQVSPQDSSASNEQFPYIDFIRDRRNKTKIYSNPHTLFVLWNFQLARILAVHKVDEIIVYGHSEKQTIPGRTSTAALLCRLLEYTETPQYLRKALFPMHPDLKHAGLLLPLESAHHLKSTEWCQFRDGIVSDRQVRGKRGSFVDIGLGVMAQIGITVKPYTRVTLDLGDKQQPEDSEFYYAEITSPLTPKEKLGLYWGYSTRQAESIQQAIQQCPYDDGYDLKIAVSKDGKPLQNARYEIEDFKHILLVLPDKGGFENTGDGNEELDAETVAKLFDQHVNPYPDCGTRGLRIEESMGIALTYLNPTIEEHFSAH